MKKWIKVLIIVVGVIVLLFIGVLVGVSPITKSVLQKHSKEWVGRRLSIEDLHINLLTGTVKANGIVLYEQDDSVAFVSLDSLFVDTKLYKLFSKTVWLQQARLVNPTVHIWQRGDVFNFTDMLKRDTTETDTTTTPSSWAVDLNQVSLVDGRVTYADLLLENHIDLRAIDLLIPSLRLGKGSSEAGLSLELGQGSIESKLALNQEDNVYKLHLKLNNIGIGVIKPYLERMLQVDRFTGALWTDLQIEGSLDHLMAMKVAGDVNLQGVDVTNGLEEPIVTCEDLKVQVNEFDLKSMSLHLGKVLVQNLHSALIVQDKGNNFSRFIKQSPDTVQRQSVEVDTIPPTAPFKLLVDEFEVVNSSFTYEDRELRQAFVYPVTNIGLTSRDFSLTGVNQLQGSLQLPQRGHATFKWRGDLNSLANTALSLNLKSVSAANFSPYSVEYTGYPIESGTISFDNDTKIVNNQLSSNNNLDIYKLNVEPKLKGVKAKVNVPLRTGIYILTDRKGNIQFDVPVNGNIKDPKFRYGKIVWQAIVNLLVKVSLSPADFIAKSIGLKGGVTNRVNIDPLEPSFTSAQYSAFGQIGELFGSKPELQVELTQCVDTAYLFKQLSVVKVKQAFYNQSHADSIAQLNVIGMQKLSEVSNTNSEFLNYVNSELTRRSLSVEGPLVAQCERLVGRAVVREAAKELMQQRNAALYSYLTTSMALPKTHVSVVNATDSLPSGKNAYYKIGYSISDQDLSGK